VLRPFWNLSLDSPFSPQARLDSSRSSFLTIREFSLAIWTISDSNFAPTGAANATAIPDEAGDVSEHPHPFVFFHLDGA
jgi:hypothetical protein